ncbi:MAG: hypothetical protein U0R19_06550 [Bryobacteraceae bacterium]
MAETTAAPLLPMVIPATCEATRSDRAVSATGRTFKYAAFADTYSPMQINKPNSSPSGRLRPGFFTSPATIGNTAQPSSVSRQATIASPHCGTVGNANSAEGQWLMGLSNAAPTSSRMPAILAPANSFCTTAPPRTPW